MEAQLYRLLQRLIVKNNINLPKEELKLQLLSHPSYPSLHSITGVLEHFGIPNAALKLPINQNVLDQIPNCFLAEIDTNSEKEVVLIQKKGKHLKVSSQNTKTVNLSHKEFLAQWTGITIAIEKDNSIVEKSPNISKTIAKLTSLILVLGLFGYTIYTSAAIFSVVHFLLSIIGIIISIFIVKHELGLQTTKTNSICNLSENTSCDEVLNAKGATIFGLFKLSDISIIAFSSYCLSWILFALAGPESYAIMSLLTLAALPFALYSIFYQFAVVKKWCPLCLGIVGVLLLQFGSLFTLGDALINSTINTASLLVVISSTALPMVVWILLKPFLKYLNTLEKTEVSHYQFKRNFAIFDALLNNNTKVADRGTIAGELVFGNENAPVQIILVSSPLCHFCKKTHQEIDQLLVTSGENLKVTIRFNATSLDPGDIMYKIGSQLLHIYQTKGKAAALLALKEAYSETIDVHKWIEKHEVIENETIRFVLQQQQEWCLANGVNFTPAVYLNNRAFPTEYDLPELTYFIDDFAEKYSVVVISKTKSA